ncbi:MAG: ABC transporter ATP-binding protein [Peptococcaceae bacterium]|nr:ABC transporter ATP-binding protein [Peptococcaceae bacterium]
MSNHALVVLNLYKKINNKTVLNDFNLAVKQGEIHALTGSAGAGKTTLLNILAGTVQPNNGTVRILNRKAGSLEVQKMIGYVPAKPSFYPGLRVLEYLVYMGILSGLEQFEAVSRAVSLLKKAEMSAFKEKFPLDLPSGMKTKIAVVQSLLSRPSLLLLDEPVTGMDQAGKDSILQMIKEMAASDNITVLLTSALWTDVASIADNITIIQDGRSILSDETANIIEFSSQGVFILQTSNNELLLEVFRRMAYLKYIVRSEQDVITVITGKVERFKKDLPGILYKLQLELMFFRQEEINLGNISQYLLKTEGD